MTHFQIILLHHNKSLVYSVLDQFEASINTLKKNQNCDVIQSRRKLATFISMNCILNLDLSKIISDFISPQLKIEKTYYYSNGINSNIVLSFIDHYVPFYKISHTKFTSKFISKSKNLKTCFIQLFDATEAKLLLLNDENEMGEEKKCNKMGDIYDFLTRLYCSAFPTSFHIHLFAHTHLETLNKMKIKMNKNIIITSIKILLYLLSTIIHQNKIPQIYNVYDNVNIYRLRRNVVREIKSFIDNNNNDQSIVDLMDHILKIQSNSAFRTSYASGRS
eukprot:419186_1